MRFLGSRVCSKFHFFKNLDANPAAAPSTVAMMNFPGVLSEELAVDMISLAFIVELIVLFSGFPGVAVFVRLK
jgi:hypothetical protein